MENTEKVELPLNVIDAALAIDDGSSGRVFISRYGVYAQSPGCAFSWVCVHETSFNDLEKAYSFDMAEFSKHLLAARDRGHLTEVCERVTLRFGTESWVEFDDDASRLPRPSIAPHFPLLDALRAQFVCYLNPAGKSPRNSIDFSHNMIRTTFAVAVALDSIKGGWHLQAEKSSIAPVCVRFRECAFAALLFHAERKDS